MEQISKGLTARPRPNKSRFLHTPAHLLADELSVKLNDRRSFARYLRWASIYDHGYLRQLLGQVLESREVRSPARLFSFLLKQKNFEQRAPTTANGPEDPTVSEPDPPKAG